MRFPRNRIRFITTHDGKRSEKGYLQLDLKGLDIEGANALVLEMEDVETARAAGDKQDDALKKARDLLGGI
jgi:hypothetical protein